MDDQKLIDWVHKYPWRSVRNLSYLAHHRWFGINTRLDRALTLYRLCNVIDESGAEASANVAMGYAFEAGRCLEALRWKDHEAAAIKHYRAVDQNRKSGKLGGQADKKRERYAVLNNLAAEKLSRFQFVSDTQAMRAARGLAAKHDREAAAPLFQVNNKPMSDDWFSEWLSAFRAHMSQMVDKSI